MEWYNDVLGAVLRILVVEGDWVCGILVDFGRRSELLLLLRLLWFGAVWLGGQCDQTNSSRAYQTNWLELSSMRPSTPHQSCNAMHTRSWNSLTRYRWSEVDGWMRTLSKDEVESKNGRMRCYSISDRIRMDVDGNFVVPVPLRYQCCMLPCC